MIRVSRAKDGLKMPVEPLGRVSGSKPLDPLDAWLILPAVICSDERLITRAELYIKLSNFSSRKKRETEKR